METYVNASESLYLKSMSKLTYLEKIKRYSNARWLQSQSFCYDQQKSSTLSATLMYGGLCYFFNNEENLLDKST
jgi:hypothetical protein